MAVLLAMAYGLAWQAAGVFHFAMGAIVVLAPYLVAALAWLPLPAALLLALGCCILVSVLLERCVYRPLAGAGSVSAMVASLGAAVVLANLIQLAFGASPQSLDLLVGLKVPLPYGNLTLLQGAQVIGVFSLVLLLAWAGRRTAFFQAAWLVAENPVLARALGLPVSGLKTVLMGLSGLLAGLAGVCLAADGGVLPGSGMGALMVGAVAVMVGGSRSLLGWVLGALLVTAAQVTVSWFLPGQWNESVVFVVLAAVFLFSPGGIAAILRKEAP